MCLACSNRKTRRMRFLLSFLVLSIIMEQGFLCAEESGGRDPFISLADKVKLTRKSVDLSVLPYPVAVNGIVWTEKVKAAVLNNDIVQEGAVWQDFIVERIEKDKVILRLGETKFEIPLVTQKQDEKNKDKYN